MGDALDRRTLRVEHQVLIVNLLTSGARFHRPDHQFYNISLFLGRGR